MRRPYAFAILFALHAGCSVYDDSMVGGDASGVGGGVGGSSGGITGVTGGSGGITTVTGGSGGSDGTGATASWGGVGVGGDNTGGSTTNVGGSGGTGGGDGGTGSTPSGGGSGGGGGGTPSGGGSGGGSGGTPPVTTYTPVIDNMEDHNNRIGLNGGDYWFTSSPDPCTTTALGSDTPVLLATQRDTSKYAIHLAGAGCGGMKVQGGFGFKKQTGTATGLPKLMPFDASAYTGISFWAKVGSATAETLLTVEVPNGTTYPDGGTCASQCYGHYSNQVILTETWQQFDLSFYEMQAAGFGVNDGEHMKTTALFQLLFSWTDTDKIDVWIDDVTFYTTK